MTLVAGFQPFAGGTGTRVEAMTVSGTDAQTAPVSRIWATSVPV